MSEDGSYLLSSIVPYVLGVRCVKYVPERVLGAANLNSLYPKYWGIPHDISCDLFLYVNFNIHPSELSVSKKITSL